MGVFPTLFRIQQKYRFSPFAMDCLGRMLCKGKEINLSNEQDVANCMLLHGTWQRRKSEASQTMVKSTSN